MSKDESGWSTVDLNEEAQLCIWSFSASDEYKYKCVPRKPLLDFWNNICVHHSIAAIWLPDKPTMGEG